MLTILSFICAIQTLLLVVIYCWAKKSKHIKFDFRFVNANMFNKYGGFHWIPCSWGVVGSFIWNRDESQDIRAIQPVENVIFSWANIRVVATIEYEIYPNNDKKKA